MEKQTHRERTERVQNDPSTKGALEDIRDRLFVKIEVQRQAKGLSEYNLAQYLNAKMNSVLGEGSDVVHNVFFDN